MSSKEQRLRRIKSAGRPPKPKLPGDSYSESPAKAARTSEKPEHRFADRTAGGGALYEWRDAYLALLERYEWRKAAYIAWKASPRRGRVPDTEEEMAALLGYKASRTFREWRRLDPGIDDAIKDMKTAPLADHLADVIRAWVDSASILGRDGHYDRKLFLEHMGTLAGGNRGSDEDEWWEASEAGSIPPLPE